MFVPSLVGRLPSFFLVVGAALLAGCGSVEIVEREHGPDIKIPSFQEFGKICGSGNNGCSDCTTGELFVSPRVEKGTAEFFRIIKHEEAHLRMGCTLNDHCEMPPEILAPQDQCPMWQNYIDPLAGGWE